MESLDFTGYEDFIKPDCNRLEFIQNRINSYGLDTVVISLEGKNHLYVKFPSSAYNASLKLKTVVAHYDRADGTPGANDNSSGVFALMNLARQLSSFTSSHNMRIVFTDGEELGIGGVKAQGAYELANHLKKNGIVDDNVFVMDSVGRGDVAVLCKTDLPDGVSSSFAKRFQDLNVRMQDILRNTCSSSWITLPSPFSDNAGFLAAGIPAVAITMLPSDEATEYANNLLRIKNLSAAVANRNVEDPKTPDYIYRESMPKTWRLFHTEFDNYLSLTKDSFLVIEKLLLEIAALKIY